MTTHTTTAPSAAIRSRRGRPMAAPAAAGLAFVAAWAVGLAVWPSNLAVDASGTRVVSAYSGHQGVAVTQYLLVEGVAAIALAIVVMALGRTMIRRGAATRGRVMLVAGAGAVVVSLVECALGLWLSAGSVPDGATGHAGVLFHLINRMDGVKMLALAAVALAAINLARGGIPRWLGYVAAPLAAAMITSGVGYLLLNNSLAQAAAVSLALLLIWVAATGVTVGREGR